MRLLMNRPAFFVSLLVLVTGLLISTVAVASTPERVVKERTEAVTAVLAQEDSPQRTQRLARVIDESLDFSYLAARAFGQHWEERSSDQQEEFLTLLRRLLQASYADRLSGRRLGEDYRIEYGEARIRGERAFVRAQVTASQRREAVVYRLYRKGDSWRIYDLVVDDISLEETYRDGYLPIIEEDGWDELISLMKERIEELEAN